MTFNREALLTAIRTIEDPAIMDLYFETMDLEEMSAADLQWCADLFRKIAGAYRTLTSGYGDWAKQCSALARQKRLATAGLPDGDTCSQQNGGHADGG